jgi:eukaryotic-like serine/threonine-protein kinase
MRAIFHTLLIAVAYFLILAASIFLTMSVLIKGDEVITPDFVGKKATEADNLAQKSGIFLKKTFVDAGPGHLPHTVIDQSPAAKTPVKEKASVLVYISADIGEVVMPDLAGQSFRDGDELLKKSKLKHGNLAYVSASDVQADTVLSQFPPAGSNVPENCTVDLLLSRPYEAASYIMPDLIGKPAGEVQGFFESCGIKISKIEEIPYFGLKSGIVVNQFPLAGFEIGAKNLISIKVSK